MYAYTSKETRHKFTDFFFHQQTPTPKSSIFSSQRDKYDKGQGVFCVLL